MHHKNNGAKETWKANGLTCLASFAGETWCTFTFEQASKFPSGTRPAVVTGFLAAVLDFYIIIITSIYQS